MKLHPSSIRKKFIWVFSGLLILVIGAALLNYGLVRRVERKVNLVEIMDDFFNISLELRRFEKNYFLYRKSEDYISTMNYLSRLEETMESQRRSLHALSPSVSLEMIDRATAEYKKDLTRLRQLNSMTVSDSSRLETKELRANIRRIGHQLTEFAEKTAEAERQSIKNLLTTNKTNLVISTSMVIICSLLLAILLGRKAMASLRILEGYTMAVSQGRILDPPPENVEEEIQALFNGFRRMNNELQLRQRQMVQSEKLASMGTMLAGVAHELNNPLSNISSSAQILAEELADGDLSFQETLIRQVEEQADKARDIVRTLLEFSRTKEFHKEILTFERLLDETVKLLHGELPSNVTLHTDLPTGIALYADKQRIQQVFLNLIKNSIDAMQQQGNIWISAKLTGSGKSLAEVEIFVEDDGPGIHPADINKIFDPFFTTKDVGKGSGLGLAIVHDIIEAHGGQITVDSRMGDGTTFIIWLPGVGESS